MAVVTDAGPWELVELGSDMVHLAPIGDLVEQELAEGCVCGPRDVLVERPGRAEGWVVVHQALDGRR